MDPVLLNAVFTKYIFMQLSGFSFLLCYAVSIVNSSKLTHLLWLISLCLSWILLPVSEALQWADDCLGRDYYTNLSTLLCQALSLGRACVCVCVSGCHYTFNTQEKTSMCMLHYEYTFVYLCFYVSAAVYMCLSSINVIFSSHSSLQWLSFCLAFCQLSSPIRRYMPAKAKLLLWTHVHGCEHACLCACVNQL